MNEPIWRDAKTDPPPDRQNCLCIMKNTVYMGFRRTDGYWTLADGFITASKDIVDLWVPLPENYPNATLYDRGD